MVMERSGDAMLSTVFVGTHRPLEDKQTLAAHIETTWTPTLMVSATGDDALGVTMGLIGAQDARQPSPMCWKALTIMAVRRTPGTRKCLGVHSQKEPRSSMSTRSSGRR
jgi:hypothetical protein